MKTFTQEERNRAFDNLPQPVKDFMGSATLMNIYKGMGTKLGLNFRQMFAVSQLTNLTLLGIQDEAAFETNIHQLLPELSNEKTRELIADVNDRIFKEARRRLQENITEPKPETMGTRPPTDREYEAYVQKERRDGALPEAERIAQEEEAQEKARIEREQTSGNQSTVVPANTPPEKTPAPSQAQAPQRPAPLVQTPTVSIASEKLKAPTVSAPVQKVVSAPLPAVSSPTPPSAPAVIAPRPPVSAPAPQVPVSQSPAPAPVSPTPQTPPPVSSIPQTSAPTAPAQNSAPSPEPKKPFTPAGYESGADPYRERPE